MAEADEISRTLTRVGTRCLTGALFVLMTGISLDMYVIAQLITDRIWISISGSVLLYLSYLGMWFIYPFGTKEHESSLTFRIPSNSTSSKRGKI